MPGLIRAAALIISLAYGGVAAGMYLNQESLLYHPNTSYASPESIGIHNAKEFSIRTPDGENLVAWFTPSTKGKPVILYLHGNGGAISDRPSRYAFYTGRGYGLLYLSYRGYGGSTCKPSEKGLLTDAEAAYDWLMSQGMATADIVLVGESMGTGIATILASRRPVAALALEAPYTSIADVAAGRYWWLPVRLLIDTQMDAAAAIPDVHVPLLIQHGDQDTIIPISYGRRLFALANEPKQFVQIPGEGHFIFNQPTFEREISFFEGLRRKQASTQ